MEARAARYVWLRMVYGILVSGRDRG